MKDGNCSVSLHILKWSGEPLEDLVPPFSENLIDQ
jgi:hypothetical protein